MSKVSYFLPAKKNVSYFAFLNHHEIKEVFEVEKIPQGGSEHGPLGL